MIQLQAFPAEIFDLIIEHLVIVIGIQKALLLRTVNQAFDAAILQAICVSQVIDIDDPDTPTLEYRMSPALRGKIVVVKSRSINVASRSYISVVAKVNTALDILTGETNQNVLASRHESIAEAVIDPVIEPAILAEGKSFYAKIEAQNLLCGAAIIGDLAVLKSLLELNESLSASADVNGWTPYFHQPLTLAAARGHLGVVRHLLDCGARLDSSCSIRGELYKFGKQADWNSQDEFNRSLSLNLRPSSALRAAVGGGHEDIVYLLLRPEYRLPTSCLEYLRAVVEGARAGRLDLIETLFKTIGKELSDFTGLDKEMIWAAIRCDQKEVVQMLLDNGADINAFPFPDCRRYHGALHLAATLGNMSMVRFLIERGADVNFNPLCLDKNLPIEGASECGQEEVVELLLEHGADLVKAFQSAVRGCQPRLIKILLSSFPDLPHRERGEIGRLALFGAIAVSNLTAMTILIEAGVSLNDGYKCLSDLPLNVAKRNCEPWVVNHLISLGAQETDEEADACYSKAISRGVRISKRTWEWVGKY